MSDTTGQLARRLASVPNRSLDDAYEAGRNCAINGANTDNCHFSHFRTPEHTAAWERGKLDASTPDEPTP